MLDRHYDNFNIAGFTYYDGVDVFGELKIGTELQFVPEPENKFDESAVALYYKDYKLGYVPKCKNCELSKFLNYGHADLFEIKINRVSPSDHPEQQVSVVVKITDKRKAEKAKETAVQAVETVAVQVALPATEAVTEVRVRKPRGRAAAAAKARAAAATTTAATTTTAPKASAEVKEKKPRGRKPGSKTVRTTTPVQTALVQTPPAESNTQTPSV